LGAARDDQPRAPARIAGPKRLAPAVTVFTFRISMNFLFVLAGLRGAEPRGVLITTLFE
jgi:hypothetical protein